MAWSSLAANARLGEMHFDAGQGLRGAQRAFLFVESASGSQWISLSDFGALA